MIRPFMRVLVFLFCFAGLAPAASGEEASSYMSEAFSENDPHLWLEEVEGDEALAWVRRQNERTLADLESDPDYGSYETAAMDVLTSKERIPYGRIRSGKVYNFWQDETHVRGLWRRTSLESYRDEEPDWETVLDLDALAEDEGKNWVFKGADCFHDKPSNSYRCLVSLSDGGKDAVIKREFDLEALNFVVDGFVTPEAKQDSAWAGPDTLLISTDWGEGSLTESGYPRVVKRWKRGTPLSDAVELLSGDVEDVGVWPYTIEMSDGRILSCVEESDTFFTSTHWWIPEEGAAPVRIPIPSKSGLGDVLGKWIFILLKEDWTVGDEAFLSGDLVAFDLAAFIETKSLPAVELVFRPSEVQAVNSVRVAGEIALLSLDDKVTGQVLRLEEVEGEWRVGPIDLPGRGQAGIAFADEDETVAFLTYEGFLTPDSLFEFDTETGRIGLLKSLPPKFDAGGLVVEQFFVESTDGTRVPYFVIHREDIAFDGETPTLLYGYGGFQISLNPGYNGTTGRLWLEKGGAYVLANIRGGGEFGPSWHQAGLKLNRQRVYDDFIAVAEDLIARKFTSPAHLGIMGGSNGGLLMGVMLNQRPDLWNAVVVQVPLLDMLRYHLLLAGASWVDEYGSPGVPEERAFLETISPYHNFNPEKEYPVPFFVTSTKDDRVHPGHARKMARLFEEAGLPFLYYENIDGGHSAAANQAERARRNALEFVYLKRRLFDEKESGDE
ncbi:MAG: prolyl oligopeptidase family serine peptidase [Verrucomicrobiales bacterium]|nr:prolyl oligopeptidase family serine peptidase [Verrucomicrobiales bacterium]